MARIKTEKNGSRKDVIVRKAATLFREKGYKAASMRDLAEAVGVEAALEGLGSTITDDDQLLALASAIFDGLLTSFQKPKDKGAMP